MIKQIDETQKQELLTNSAIDRLHDEITNTLGIEMIRPPRGDRNFWAKRAEAASKVLGGERVVWGGVMRECGWYFLNIHQINISFAKYGCFEEFFADGHSLFTTSRATMYKLIMLHEITHAVHNMYTSWVKGKETRFNTGDLLDGYVDKYPLYQPKRNEDPHGESFEALFHLLMALYVWHGGSFSECYIKPPNGVEMGGLYKAVEWLQSLPISNCQAGS